MRGTTSAAKANRKPETLIEFGRLCRISDVSVIDCQPVYRRAQMKLDKLERVAFSWVQAFTRHPEAAIALADAFMVPREFY